MSWKWSSDDACALFFFAISFNVFVFSCADDVGSVCGSVYDEYDPYDFIYTGSGNNSLCDPMYAAVNKAESIYSSPIKTNQTFLQTVDKGRTTKIAEVS